MSNKRKSRASVVVAVWKARGGEIEAYSSLPSFLSHNPTFNKFTIESYISRKKVPYETDEIKLTRIYIKTNISYGRSAKNRR